MAVSYRYDSMNRLTNEDCNGAGERYAYDLCGNRLLKEQYVGGSVDVTEGYRYDKNGSIISEEEEGRKSEYHYDLLNRQTYVKTLDGKEQENFYDGEGLRAGLNENGKKTTFLFYNDEILAECDRESAPIRRYVRGNGLSYVQNTHDNIYHAYHQDEQGSTAYITGQGRETENIYQYDAFGNLTERHEGIENRILYTGQKYDQETGQYYLRARYYNPVVGRFLQEDTYRGDGLNLYAYCANNPVVYYDPSGNASQSCGDKSDKNPNATYGSEVGNDKKITAGFDDWLNKGDSNNKVYFGIKDGTAQYTGITRQSIDARLDQHNRSGKGFAVLEIQYDNLTRNQARAIKQYFIEKGPNNLNKINSIGQNNKYYDDAIAWAKQYLGK